MNIKQPTAGEVWRVACSGELLAVVVFAWAQEGLPTDLRIVPLSIGPDALEMSSERDVVLGQGHHGLAAPGGAVIAQAWNARTIAAEDLAYSVGSVSDEALEIIRAAEMIGIAPNAEEGIQEWLGPRGSASATRRSSAARESIRRWDDAARVCELFRAVQPRNMTRAEFRARPMYEGAVVVVKSDASVEFYSGEFPAVSPRTDENQLSRAA